MSEMHSTPEVAPPDGQPSGGAPASPDPNAPGRVVAAASDVTKRFGRTQALAGVTLEIELGTVHGLVGRNGSGKSTLVSLFTGLQSPDTGTISINGQATPPTGERHSWRQLVACVYQHSALVPQLTVAENLSLSKAPGHRVVSWRQIKESAARLLDEWDLQISPAALVSELSANEQQMLEIARATNAGTRFLVLDEPTTRLSQAEVQRLLKVIKLVRRSGTGTLFISHYLQEAFEVCDKMSVIRDGKIVAQMSPQTVQESDVIDAMVGSREQMSVASAARSTPAAPAAGESCLEVAGLNIGPVHELTFKVGQGECVGLAGSMNSGNRLAADCLAGLARQSSGQVIVGGTRLTGDSVKAAVDAGIGFVPADRGYNGLVPVLSVEDNITMAVGRRIARYGVLRPSVRRRIAEKLADDVGVAGGSISSEVRELSGGNQQKVVVGRAIASRPRLLILVEPTSGVDVASSRVIADRISAALDSGCAVLIVSERPEELALCTRVLVMFQGRLIAELGANRTDHELVSAIEGVGA